ncbi:MAG: hypothetical protein RBS68_15735 [Anaerolineales bacterium]|jgi:hypothetical protein|nr:hypothetical protein [Anaerolineales bacterium]
MSILRINKSHPWLVIEDPSKDFVGRQFQPIDLQLSAENFTWPNGIKFKNTKTGEIKTYRDGVLLDEAYQNE